MSKATGFAPDRTLQHTEAERAAIRDRRKVAPDNRGGARTPLRQQEVVVLEGTICEPCGLPIENGQRVYRTPHVLVHAACRVLQTIKGEDEE